MKKIALLFVAVLAVSSLAAQPKWSLKASGAIGGSLNLGEHRYYNNGHYYYDGWSDIYDNSKLFYEAGLGFRIYALKWLYFGADVSYSRYENKYDSFYIRDGRRPNQTLVLDGVGVSFLAGFAYHNRSKFYPFIEMGLMPYFAFNDDFYDKSVYFGTNVKLGGGVNLSENFALELAFVSSARYYFGSDYYHYEYDDYYYNSDYSWAANFGLGVNLSCVINF